MARAEQLFAEGLAEANVMGIRLIRGRLLTCLGRVAQARGDLAAAEARYNEAIGPYRQAGYLEGIADVFHRLAEVAAARARPERAARLMGAASLLPFTAGSLEPPFEYEMFRQCLAEVRTVLGDAGFDDSLAAGRALPLDESIAEALAE